MFTRKKQKRLEKGQYYSAILRQFWIISEDFRRLTKRSDHSLAKMSEEPTKHFTVTSSEAVNTKKLANLTANTKNYGQRTLNTKPHSDPP